MMSSRLGSFSGAILQPLGFSTGVNLCVGTSIIMQAGFGGTVVRAGAAGAVLSYMTGGVDSAGSFFAQAVTAIAAARVAQRVVEAFVMV